MIAALAALLRRARDQRFVRDTLVMQVSSAITSATYMGTSVLIARHLGDHELGRWTTSRELFSLTFTVLTAGLLPVAVSRYSRSVGEQDRAACLETLASLLKLFLIASVALSALVMTAGPPFAEWFYEDRQVGWIAGLLCLTSVCEALKSMTVVALRGTRQMAAYARFDILVNLIRVGLIGIAVLAEGGILGIMGAFLAHAVVMALLSASAYGGARRGDPKLAPPAFGEVLGAVRRAPMGTLLTSTSYLAVFKVMNTAVFRLPLLILPAAALTDDGGFDANGQFFIAWIVAFAMEQMLLGINQALLPALGLKLGQTEIPFEKMGRLIGKVILVSGGGMTLLVSLAILLMDPVIIFLWGEEFTQAAELFPWLAAGYAATGFQVANDPFYLYSGRMPAALRINIVLFVLGVGMIVTGAVVAGPKGAAIGGTLCRASGMVHLVYIGRYFRRTAAEAEGSTP